MAECDERSWLAALSLMNSGMEADDGSNETFVAVNGLLGHMTDGEILARKLGAVEMPA
jgi:hypothetical protein